jgi:dephospho-CoA kinase
LSAFRVGLTGGLASGKSTVAGLLARAGITVVDADELVAELYEAGGEGTAAIRDLLGDSVISPEGGVDKAALGRRVFADPEARRRVEHAIHPLVRDRFREIAAKTPGIVALEATLLVEAGYAPDFDWIVTVEADPATRRDRAVARGLPRGEADARLDAQGDGARRRAAAHRVIRNDGSLEDLRSEVARLVTDLRAATAASVQQTVKSRPSR